MQLPYLRSIFANELAQLLRERGLTIENLRRTPFTFDRQKVDRLAGSLQNLSQLPALSHGELMSLALLLKLAPEDRLRLYAALIALGTQRLLLDYLSPQRAWEITCEVRDAAFQWLLSHGSDEDLLRRRITEGMAGVVEHPEREDETLAAALDAYDQGVAALALGLFHGEGTRGRQELQRAILYLEQATTLLEEKTPAATLIEDWLYWSSEAQRVLDQARSELD